MLLHSHSSLEKPTIDEVVSFPGINLLGSNMLILPAFSYHISRIFIPNPEASPLQHLHILYPLHSFSGVLLLSSSLDYMSLMFSWDFGSLWV